MKIMERGRDLKKKIDTAILKFAVMWTKHLYEGLNRSLCPGTMGQQGITHSFHPEVGS